MVQMKRARSYCWLFFYPTELIDDVVAVAVADFDFDFDFGFGFGFDFGFDSGFDFGLTEVKIWSMVGKRTIEKSLGAVKKELVAEVAEVVNELEQ